MLEWPWIKAIGYAVRLTIHADGRETNDVRYYILSRYLSGPRFEQLDRGRPVERVVDLDRAEVRAVVAEHQEGQADHNRQAHPELAVRPGFWISSWFQWFGFSFDGHRFHRAEISFDFPMDSAPGLETLCKFISAL